MCLALVPGYHAQRYRFVIGQTGGTTGPGAWTVYLPEDRFGLVSPGQTASVRVDTYPDRLFEGTVSQVADQAEFTPSNIQTKDDRVRLVYAVTISLDNADLALKPGMIADVLFGE